MTMNRKRILQVLDRNWNQCHTPANTAVNRRVL